MRLKKKFEKFLSVPLYEKKGKTMTSNVRYITILEETSKLLIFINTKDLFYPHGIDTKYDIDTIIIVITIKASPRPSKISQMSFSFFLLFILYLKLYLHCVFIIVWSMKNEENLLKVFDFMLNKYLTCSYNRSIIFLLLALSESGEENKKII